MKKSEMLEVMRVSKLLNFFEKEPLEDEMEVILNAMEKAGMLAPMIMGAYQKYGVNVYRENNYWEDEDENK
jgi:hypothetical protein